MSKEVTPIVEEYLEVIYKLQEKKEVARTSDIVASLKVSPGTVTNTVERLERDGLIVHVPYKGAKLTDKGQRIALNVIRRHRLSERLLTDILHVEWEKAHEAACKLEHAIDNDVIKKLEKALNHPKTCPHGNPIPTKCGGIIEEKSQPLVELNVKESCMIMKVIEEKPELLHYLGTLGLVPNTKIEILDKAPFDGPITLKVGKANRVLSHEVASIIKVRRIE
ncbi:MAG: metal-dependent transcriptional regulator [Nitrososphaeria archaeon]